MKLVRYTYATRVGMFRIELRNGSWQVWCESEMLGPGYQSAALALDDLAGGHTDWPGTTDPSTLGLPDALSGWKAWAPRLS